MGIIPNDLSVSEVREEVNFRTHRAGYTCRNGGPLEPKIRSMPFSNKGRENYARIFGHE